jgi:hypothetical protein
LLAAGSGVGRDWHNSWSSRGHGRVTRLERKAGLDTLPPAMVAELEALGRAVLGWAQRHRDASLAEHEQGVLEQLRTAAPGLLAAVVAAATTTLDARQPRLPEACPDCAARTRGHGWRTRRVLTRCGVIPLERPWYRCPACHRGWSPTDRTLGIDQGRISAGVQRWLADLAAGQTFRETVGLLSELTGLQVSAETVRRLTEARGTGQAEAQSATAAAVQARRAPVEPVDLPPGDLAVEVDGVMVRYADGWHEVKLGVVGGVQAGELSAKSYVAARGDPGIFGPLLVAEAARRGALDIVDREVTDLARPALARLRPMTVIADGAPWIWNLAAEHFGERTEIVDLFHVAEHLWAVAQALAPGDAAAQATWAQARVRELRDLGPRPVQAALREVAPTTDEAREVVRRARAYVATNAGRMDYPGYRARGLPLGSGAVESSAKSVVQLRMKRPGMRWSERGARAILTLRTQRLSQLEAEDVSRVA